MESDDSINHGKYLVVFDDVTGQLALFLNHCINIIRTPFGLRQSKSKEENTRFIR